jgi:hypothetical protein
MIDNDWKITGKWLEHDRKWMANYSKPGKN